MSFFYIVRLVYGMQCLQAFCVTWFEFSRWPEMSNFFTVILLLGDLKEKSFKIA